MLQVQFIRFLEKGHVSGVGPGPSALDIVDAELVELFGHAHFCAHGEGDTLTLRAISQGGVVYQYVGIGLVVHEM